jgi:hypothetical protein
MRRRRFSANGNDEALDRLAKTRHLQIIVVGIDNGAEHRMQELDAWDNPEHGKAEGKSYVDFIVDVVKPYVDAHYRTKPDRENTGIMGSSLGGLISLCDVRIRRSSARLESFRRLIGTRRRFLPTTPPHTNWRPTPGCTYAGARKTKAWSAT